MGGKAAAHKKSIKNGKVVSGVGEKRNLSSYNLNDLK
jgi:hypothetical protein